PAKARAAADAAARPARAPAPVRSAALLPARPGSARDPSARPGADRGSGGARTTPRARRATPARAGPARNESRAGQPGRGYSNAPARARASATRPERSRRCRRRERKWRPGASGSFRVPLLSCQLEQRPDQVLEDRAVEGVDDVLALALGQDEARLPQHRQMARDGRLREMKALHQRADGVRPGREQAEDLAAGAVGERAEGGVGFLHMRICLYEHMQKVKRGAAALLP